MATLFPALHTAVISFTPTPAQPELTALSVRFIVASWTSLYIGSQQLLCSNWATESCVSVLDFSVSFDLNCEHWNLIDVPLGGLLRVMLSEAHWDSLNEMNWNFCPRKKLRIRKLKVLKRRNKRPLLQLSWFQTLCKVLVWVSCTIVL